MSEGRLVLLFHCYAEGVSHCIVQSTVVLQMQIADNLYLVFVPRLRPREIAVDPNVVC